MSNLGVVIIGRNEGERLVRCITSVLGIAKAIVYVDSGSTDRSVTAARDLGTEVVKLASNQPFTAARARNAGWHRLLELCPDVAYVQFVDGDCEIDPGWFDTAQRTLETQSEVAVVCGRRRERFPERSIYNRLCDLEWDTPVGEASACGGDAMMRVGPLRQSGGYRESLIAGEEPELCARLRAAGGRVVRLDCEMTMHDAAMTRFGQWWRRALRAGYAYAEVSRIHGRIPDRTWVRQFRSNWFWGLILPLSIIATVFFYPIISLLILSGYAVLFARIYFHGRKRGWTASNSRSYALFGVLAKFPLAIGQLRYYWNRITGRTQPLIEYKTASAANSPMPRIAYLVNQYPHVSHSFIRREIRGLESLGFDVARYSIRRPSVEVVDADDREESQRTQVVLDAGWLALILVFIWTMISRPVKSCRAAALAWKFGRQSGALLRTGVYFAEACLLIRWLRGGRADHLHAHFGTNSATVAALVQALGGPPYSFTVHGPEEFDRPQSLSLTDKIHRANFVVAISSFGRSQLFRWCPVDDWQKIHVVHCGVDEAFLNLEPDPVPAEPRLVCVGRLAEQKGQLLLISAVAQLNETGIPFELVLAGDGPMRPQIEAAVIFHRLQSKVRITGWLSNHDVREELKASRLVVLPSFAEGLPVVLMEALALGRPVVTTYVAGIPELVQNGVHGWLIPPGDIDALTAALAKGLRADSQDLAAMGLAGVQAVRDAHDARKEAVKLARLFTERDQSLTKSPVHYRGTS